MVEKGVSQAGKKISEKSGDLIMTKVSGMRRGTTSKEAKASIPDKASVPTKASTQAQEEINGMILNRLISDNCLSRRRVRR